MILLLLLVTDRDPESVRDSLRKVLDRPEFREKLPSDFWKNLREYLKLKPSKQKDRPENDRPARPEPSPEPASAGSGIPMKLIFFVVLAIFAAFLILMVYQAWASRAPPAPPATPSPAAVENLPNPLSQNSDEWARQADELYRQGKIAEAIRALYLCVLSHLHAQNWIDYHPCKTNWEYIRRFGGPEDGRGTLKQLTQVFDRKWYGRKSCVAADFESSRRLAQGILRLRGQNG